MRATTILALVVMVTGCTPSSLKWQLLAPVPEPTTTTALELFSSPEADPSIQMPPNADKIVILAADSVVAAITLYEFEDIFWLDAYVLNDGGEPFVINPSQIALLDGSRVMYRQLAPHEAANIYAARVTEIPPYQPKYIYDVRSSTMGMVNVYGNQATYSGTTRTTVTEREDPYHQLGYSIGAALAADKNKRYLNMAGAIYAVGFVDGTEVPAQTAARGGIYWLKGKTWVGPLTLRFLDTGYEVRFTEPGK